MDESNESTWEPYVGRGAQGGMLGMLIVIAFGTAYILWRDRGDNFFEMFALMGIFGLVSGVIAGAAVGYIIYKVSRRLRTQPNAAVRMAIGIGSFLIYGLLSILTSSRPFYLTFELTYAIVVGGLAGLMSRANFIGLGEPDSKYLVQSDTR